MPEPVDSHLASFDPVGEAPQGHADGLDLLDAVGGDLLVDRRLRRLENGQRSFVTRLRPSAIARAFTMSATPFDAAATPNPMIPMRAVFAAGAAFRLLLESP